MSIPVKHRNRAKCRKCEQVIESKSLHDFVECPCKEIYVDGGNEHFRAGAIDWSNFLRVDDDGNEIEVKVHNMQPDPPKATEAPVKKLTPMQALDEFISFWEDECSRNPTVLTSAEALGMLKEVRELLSPPSSQG